MPDQTYTRTVNDESQTRQLAADFAECIAPGTTVALNGTLGAGKTRFVQAFAEACGVPAGHVVSPTYVICQQYAGNRLNLHHLDVYRLGSEEEFLELGSDEMFADAGIKMIEWGEQVASCLPDDRIDLSIEVTGETSRLFRFHGLGDASAQIVESLTGEKNGVVYKIVPRELWEAAEKTGEFDGAPIDHADGFIHLSSADQVAETALKHFADQTDLLLVAFATDSLAAMLRWEPSRGGALFPHVFGTLPTALATSVVPLQEGLDSLD